MESNEELAPKSPKGDFGKVLLIDGLYYEPDISSTIELLLRRTLVLLNFYSAYK